MKPEYKYTTPGTAWNADAERRMADLAAFADGLVHDIRNPLNVIRSNLYLLRQRLGTDDPRLVKPLNRIDDQVTAELRHLEGIQAFYQTDRMVRQRLQLNDLIRTVVETTTIPDGCDLSMDLAEDLPVVSADPQLVEAGLRALLRNALEAVSAGGSVCIGTTRVEEHARLWVEDAGPGMPADVQARAFEPFYTTKRAHAGLGLALVARIAQAHGTEVLLGSQPDMGTEAVLELPFAGEA